MNRAFDTVMAKFRPQSSSGSLNAVWHHYWRQPKVNVYVIYEQRERVFHRDIQTPENNGENTSAQRECFCPLFSSVHILHKRSL